MTLAHEIGFAFHAAATRVHAIQGAEAALIAVVCLALLVAVVIRTAHGLADRWEWLLMLFVLVPWLAPLGQSVVAYWRSDSLLIPAALLIVRMRLWLASMLTACVMAVFPFLAYFYFANQLF